MGYKYRDTKAISIDPVTETGNIVTFENPDDVTGITSLIADITPKQDGTPWVSPDNTAPYLLRQSPQYGNEYNNEYDTLIGGSIAWNQMLANGNFAENDHWHATNGTLSISNNKASLTGNGGVFVSLRNETNNLEVKQGHKYLCSFFITADIATSKTCCRLFRSDALQVEFKSISLVANQRTKYESIANATASYTNSYIYAYPNQTSNYSGTTTFEDFMLIDLTATFGTEIADYVYSLEQSTAGSGIAWLKSYGFLTKDYYAYNDGSLVSVKTSEHRTTGKNLLPSSAVTDITNNGCRLQADGNGKYVLSGTATGTVSLYASLPQTALPSSTIYLHLRNDFSTAQISVFLRKGNSNVAGATLNGANRIIALSALSGATFDGILINIPSGFAISGTITIEPSLELDNSVTAYEPYESHSFPLDSDLELRGIPKLSNGSLYYDGDEYTADGTVTRKYGIVDLGTLNWLYNSNWNGSGAFYLASPLSDVKQVSDLVIPNAICSEYVAFSRNALYENSSAKGFCIPLSLQISIRDSAYSDPAQFKTAMSGVYLVYEKASISTEQADPFASPQIVSPNGTEEYVDTRSVPVPVGHRTVYKNIAPISGYSEINIYVSPTEDAEDATVYPIDLNGVRYGKQMNVTTGQLEVCPYYASYNGETLTGEWISDRDVYSPGTTPSIGAQVVNIGGTLTTEQLLPTDIKPLVGTNNVWSDSGDITLTYAVDPSLYITLPKEAVSMDGRYLERMIDGYTTLYVKGRESLGIELNTYSVGTADGEKIKGSRYPSRTLTIGFQLLCEDEVEFRAKFNQLNNLLSIGKADFIFADEPTMFFTGTPVMDATIEPGRNNVTGEWKLYCDYPFKRSVEPTVLSSTDSGVLVGDHEATFIFDYKGVMPAKPILRCEFDSTKSGGDYSEDGDCGFVAFLNQDESIIQLGNPEIIDLDAINKSATLINSEFSSLTNWTAVGMTAGNIVDPYWNNGEGQTQSYAKGIGTLSRTTTGAVDFDFSIVHRLCVNASSQTGAFKVGLMNDGDTIVGFAIEKTGNGTSATVSYIVNGVVVGTDNIDISYNNANFGFCSRTEYFVVTDINGKETILTKDNYYRRKFGFYDDFFGFGGFRHGSQIRKVRRKYDYSQSNLNSRISRNGNAVTFQIGNLAKRTFKNNDIENVPCYDVKFETTGNFDTNAIRSCSFIRKTGVAFAKIPNVFTAGDIVEADCNSANVFMYRNGSLVGHLEPQYGALGNNWEDFNIKVGHNIIRAVWSEWSNPAYKPVIKIIFNEVYI